MKVSGSAKGGDGSRDSRKRCLQAGVHLFFQQPPEADPFRGITFDGVARKAGLSRQGMQYHWSTKKSFTEDLAAHLLGNEDLYAEDFEKILAVVKTTGNQPLFDAIARIATADVEMLTDNPVFSAMTTLAVVYVRGNQKLSEMASRGYRELDDSTWSEIYNIALARAGRVPREPMTGNAIGAILQALVEGSGIRHLFDPGVLSQPDRMIRSHYGLYAMAVASILAVMTRPADGQDRRTVEVLISDVLSGEV